MRHKVIGLLAAVLTLAVGCGPAATPVKTPSTESLASTSAAEPAPASDLCSQAKGNWDAPSETCSLVVTNAKDARLSIKASYPVALLTDPGAGPVLTDFVRKFFATYASVDDGLTRNSTVELTYVPYEHAPSTKSILFKVNSFFGGAAHPNTELTTFTFDSQKHTRLQLADLLCAGADPNVTLPPIVRPFLQAEVDKLNADKPEGNSPLPVTEFEPVTAESGPHHTYVKSYDAWVLDGEDLVLLLPAVRTGPVGAGLVQPRVPVAELRQGCAA